MASMLENLMGNLLSGGGTDAVAKKTGASKTDVSGLLGAALPVLLESMHGNAKDEKSAKALDKALEDHAAKGEKSAEDLVQEADEADGAKIIEHILGGNADSVKQGLAKKTGMDVSQVSSILANAAPAVMNMLGHQKKSAGHDANGLTDMLGGLLSGGKGGLDLGGLVNMAMADKDGDGKSDLLGALGGLTGLLTGK